MCNCIAVYFFTFLSLSFLLLLCYHCSMGSVPEIKIDWILHVEYGRSTVRM